MVAATLRRLNWPLIALLVVLLAAQGMIGGMVRKVPPQYHILAAPPGKAGFAAQSMGDLQFGFRMASLRLQHVGSLDGRIFPFRKIDYGRLSRWFALLDDVDPAPSIVPTMAAFLFVSTQNPSDTRYLVDYLEKHALRDPSIKWRWLAQAVHIAWYQLGDRPRALALAKELAGLPVADLPYWARQMPAFILLDMGEKQSARAILEAIAKTDKNLPDNERKWMAHYIKRHLQD